VHLLDFTMSAPAENLAADEALLDACEKGETGDEVLRFWESAEPFVVVGYSNRIATEVDEAACAAAGIPILRRCSGGGTVVQGPGCLSYALVLRIPASGPLTTVTSTNQFIMSRHAAALGNGCESCGTTDLAVGGLKFSGNAQRRKKQFLLFHGTFLYRYDLALIGRLLRLPSREPDYRQGRAHAEFLMNLPVSAAALKAAIAGAWGAAGDVAVPTERIRRLVVDRYTTAEWNRKF